MASDAGASVIPAAVWQDVLRIVTHGDDTPRDDRGDGPADLLALYRELAACVAGGSYVAAHLGQSLDGHIATATGASRYITGVADREHNQRMRALFDAVLVGRATVQHDDPRLTVRSVAGDHPVRVVIDPNRSLGPDYHIFSTAEAPTLVVCGDDRVDGTSMHGCAEVVGVARTAAGGLSPRAILSCLADRGLGTVFIEGGGETVSRFLAAGELDRLQVAVAPLLLGEGRAGARVPAVRDPAAGLHLDARWYALGEDMLCDCRIRQG